MVNRKIKIGTRASKLALIQTDMAMRALMAAHNLNESDFEIFPVITKGDKILDRRLDKIGGKGLFTEELEAGLLDGSLDFAVHSLKDMPAAVNEKLALDCVLEREDARDAFVSNKYKTLAEMPSGSILGSSSSRRGAIITNIRKDIEIVNFRGNLIKRFEKLDNNEVDACILAVAGLKRLGIAENRYNPIEINTMLPAVSQGAICIQYANDNQKMRQMLLKINHKPTQIRTDCERAFLKAFGGDCSTPIAAHSIIKNDIITLKCLIAKPDGSTIIKKEVTGPLENYLNLGVEAADLIKTEIDDRFFD